MKPCSPFERRRRALARLALYTSLVLVTGASLGVYWLVRRPAPTDADMGWWKTEWAGDPAVRLLQQLIRIDTAPGGDEYAAALLLATPLRAAGLPVTIERIGERHANLWAVLEGEDREALVLLSHLDVDPIDDESRWEVPPFAGHLDPPYVHGRGSFDMKSYTVAQLQALLHLAARHPRPRRTVVLLATSSEETGSELGVQWLLRERPELFEQIWAVITEGGLIEARSLSDPKYWGIEFGQKRYVELLACAADEARLRHLSEDLRTVGFPTTGLRVPAGIRDFWRVYRPTRDRQELRDLLADPDRFLRDPAAFLALPDYLKSMLRDEVVAYSPTPAPGGGWQMRLLLHLLPGTELEEARARLLPPWLLGGVTLLQVDQRLVGGDSPLDHPAVAAIRERLRTEHPEADVGPFFLPWTMTDARFLRPRGIPTYGFSPFFILTPETLRVGFPNERIGLPGFSSGVDVYVALVENVAGRGSVPTSKS